MGCLWAAAALGIVAAGAAVVTLVALRQIRTESRVAQSFSETPAADDGARRQGALVLDVAVAQVVLVPAPAGAPIRVEAAYDPRRYDLEQNNEEAPGGGFRQRVRFAPSGSEALALYRLKLGADPPRLRIAVPADVTLRIEGRVTGGFAAIELGGLSIEALEMRVEGAAVTVSFREPLDVPMDHLILTGDKGSIEVTGLGNASPRRAVLKQRLGALDLDLRGAWLRDAEIRVDARFAGGSVWLPVDVEIEGVPGVMLPRPPDGNERPRPRLRLSVTRKGGGLLFVE